MIIVRKVIFALGILLAILQGCQDATGQLVNKVTPAEAQKLMQQDQTIQILDVRTPEEVAGGVIGQPIVANYNANELAGAIAMLDKNKPVVVYCYAGGRSASAADELAKAGFKKIYDIKGGIRAWTESGLPVAAAGAKPKAKTNYNNVAAELEQLLANGKPVLIDFYAPWCGPCKKMAPSLEKLAKENPSVKILKVNTDDNQELARMYKVEEIPTLVSMKQGKVIGRNIGFQSDETLAKLIQDLK